MTSDQEALLYLSKAYDELRYADDARRGGNYGGAVSMAFYAAFYSVRGILAFLREEPKTHQGTKSRFHLLAVYQSDFPSEVAVLLDELRADRQEADYNVWTMDSWDDEAAVDAIAKARRFVEEAASWLDRHNPADR